jgi:hypothetical protein
MFHNRWQEIRLHPRLDRGPKPRLATRRVESKRSGCQKLFKDERTGAHQTLRPTSLPQGVAGETPAGEAWISKSLPLTRKTPQQPRNNSDGSIPCSSPQTSTISSISWEFINLGGSNGPADRARTESHPAPAVRGLVGTSPRPALVTSAMILALCPFHIKLD